MRALIAFLIFFGSAEALLKGVVEGEVPAALEGTEEECRGAIDMVLAIDESGSVDSDEYEMMKEAMTIIVRGFTTGHQVHQAKVAIYSWSGCGKYWDYTWEDDQSRSALVQFIQGFERHNDGCTTPTGEVLKELSDYLYENKDPARRTVVFFLTDGNPYVDSENWMDQAEELRQVPNNVVWALGIGEDNGECPPGCPGGCTGDPCEGASCSGDMCTSVLEGIAEENIHSFADFQTLWQEIKDILAQEICPSLGEFESASGESGSGNCEWCLEHCLVESKGNHFGWGKGNGHGSSSRFSFKIKSDGKGGKSGSSSVSGKKRRKRSSSGSKSKDSDQSDKSDSSKGSMSGFPSKGSKGSTDEGEGPPEGCEECLSECLPNPCRTKNKRVKGDSSMSWWFGCDSDSDDYGSGIDCDKWMDYCFPSGSSSRKGKGWKKGWAWAKGHGSNSGSS